MAQQTVYVSAYKGNPECTVLIYNLSAYNPTRVLSATHNGVSAGEGYAGLNAYLPRDINNDASGFMIEYVSAVSNPTTTKATIVIETGSTDEPDVPEPPPPPSPDIPTTSSGFFLNQADSSVTVTGVSSFANYANLSFSSSTLIDVKRCITDYGLSANKSTINNRYKDYYTCIDDTPLFNGFLSSDFSTSTYPWLGTVTFKNYKINGNSPTFILNGTTPLMGGTIGDGSMYQSGVTYTVNRTSSGIYIYKNGILEISFLASRFHKSVVPLRCIIVCQGGGGGGANANMYTGGRGGGAGGFTFGIWDFVEYPTIQATIGAGGAAGQSGGTTSVYGITTYGSKVLMMSAPGGTGGTISSAGSGGGATGTNNLTYASGKGSGGSGGRTERAAGNGPSFTAPTIANPTYITANNKIQWSSSISGGRNTVTLGGGSGGGSGFFGGGGYAGGLDNGINGGNGSEGSGGGGGCSGTTPGKGGTGGRGLVGLFY